MAAPGQADDAFPIILRGQYTETELMAAASLPISSRWGMGLVVILLVILGAALAQMFVLDALLPAQSTLPMALVVPVLFAVGALLVLIALAVVLQLRLVRRLREQGQDLLQPFMMEIGAETFVLRGARRDVHVRWPEVVLWREVGNVLVFSTRQHRGIIVPKRLFQEAAQLALLRRCLAGSGAHSVDKAQSRLRWVFIVILLICAFLVGVMQFGRP